VLKEPPGKGGRIFGRRRENDLKERAKGTLSDNGEKLRGVHKHFNNRSWVGGSLPHRKKIRSIEDKPGRLGITGRLNFASLGGVRGKGGGKVTKRKDAGSNEHSTTGVAEAVQEEFGFHPTSVHEEVDQERKLGEQVHKEIEWGRRKWGETSGLSLPGNVCNLRMKRERDTGAGKKEKKEEEGTR